MGSTITDTLIQGPELALIAVGMTLVFGVSRFANIAQVEFATLGAYGTVLASAVIGGSVLTDAVVSIAFVGAFAVIMYYAIFIRLLRRSPATAMIGSLAVSILLRALIQTLAGPTPKQLNVPLERGVDLFGSLVTPTEIRIMVIGAAALAALMAVVRLTPFGRSIRAVSTNPDLAEAAGINTRLVRDCVWLIGGLLGALAGVLIAIDTQVSLNMGFQLLLPVFAVTLLGGFGSPGGAIVGSYLLAFIEAAVLRIDFGKLVGAGSVLVPTDYRPAIGFVLLVVVLMVRPQGIFGREVRRA